MVAAVAEGRRIYANIRRFLRYALAGGLAELLVMLTGPLVGLPLALLPGQILGKAIMVAIAMPVIWWIRRREQSSEFNASTH